MSVQKLLATFVAVLLTATPVVLLTSTASPAKAQTYNVTQQSVITTTDLNPFVANPNLNFYADLFSGETIAGTTIRTCLNDDCAQDIGALIIIGANDDCKEGTPVTEGQDPYCRKLGYCVQADTPINIFGSPWGAHTFDKKAEYLAWKYSNDYHGGINDNMGGILSLFSAANGNTAPVFAAAQSLIWKWVSDANGTDVWDGFNTTEAVSDANTGFSVDTVTNNWHPDKPIDDYLNLGYDNLGGPYLYADDPVALMAAANQAILDLEIEATAKQGPWTVADSADYSGIVITGAVGPIYGETVTFSDDSTAVTDANGYVAWPDGATDLDFEAPGIAYLGVGNNDSQDLMLAFGQNVNVTRPEVEVIAAPTPTPTATPTPSPTPTATPTPSPTPEDPGFTDDEDDDELPFVGSSITPIQVAAVLVLMGMGITVTAVALRRPE